MAVWITQFILQFVAQPVGRVTTQHGVEACSKYAGGFNGFFIPILVYHFPFPNYVHSHSHRISMGKTGNKNFY